MQQSYCKLLGGGGKPPRFLNGQELFDKDIQETLFYGMRLSSGAIVILRYAVGESSVIYVDVDGSKGYNRVGREYFYVLTYLTGSIALGEATCHARQCSSIRIISRRSWF